MKTKKDELKELIIELIDKCDEEDLKFYQGHFSNIFEKGINFTLEGEFITQKL